MTNLLVRPVGDITRMRINNFGIELEVLENGAAGNPDEDNYCECSHCQGHGTDPSSEFTDFLNVMRNAGMIDRYQHQLHEYHCGCGQCSYDRETPLMTAQEDCSVGIEFVSRILHADTDAPSVLELIDAYEAACRRAYWRPDGYEDCGNHIHVSSRGTDDGAGVEYGRTRRLQATNLIASLFNVGRWDKVAAGGCNRLRDYNGEKPRKRPVDNVIDSEASTSWLRDGYNTLEFRLWNTPKIADRIAAHAGISIATLRWAHAQIAHDRAALAAMTQATFIDHVTPRMGSVLEVIHDAVPDEFQGPAQAALEEWTAA